MSEVRILPGALSKTSSLQVKRQTGRLALGSESSSYHYQYHNGVSEGTGEPVAEPLHCLSLHVRHDVRVGVQREGNPRMAQDFLQDLRMLTRFEPEGGECVSEIVGPDIRQTRYL